MDLSHEKSSEMSVYINNIIINIELLDIEYLDAVVSEMRRGSASYDAVAFIVGGPDKLKQTIRDSEIAALTSILELAKDRKTHKERILKAQEDEAIRQANFDKIRNMI
jgi:hypothetical protein